MRLVFDETTIILILMRVYVPKLEFIDYISYTLKLSIQEIIIMSALNVNTS